MPLLTVTDLKVAINGEPILRDIDLSVDSGKVLGIVGESGSGKSLTAYSIMRLLPAGSTASGRISFAGKSLFSLSEAAMCKVRGRDIGMIFQEPMTALNPLRTIGDQIAETIKIHTDANRDQVRRLLLDTLRRVELPPEQFPPSRYPHELSGGQRQRVVIAMAIALRPRLLIADEPTTALDVTTQAQILKLLRRLVDEDGLGLMLISHDLAVVANTADEIAVMKNGVVLDAGTPKRIFSGDSHPYATELLEASTHVPAIVSRAAEKSDVNGNGNAPLLEVKGLVREYKLPRDNIFARSKSFRAVDNVSFTLQHGENLGLVGESGCGKSTLTRAILGLEVLQGGSVRLNGQQVLFGERRGLAPRHSMQAVFQDPFGSFNPRHKVAKLIAEPLYAAPQKLNRIEQRSAVAQVIERVGLRSQDGEKYIHEFSGGQRQRIAIARALISRPALIILDEAVSALDVSVRAKVLDLLVELSAEFDIAYLFISHDLSVVRSVTERVLVMKNGRIVEQGMTGTVFNSPQHPYTAELVNSVPVLGYSVR